jgi:Trypsin-like peptidase domain
MKFNMHRCAFFLLTLVVSLGAGAQSSQTLPDVVARAQSAVVTIRAFDATGDLIGLGSGFRIGGGRFVTNAHVLAGAAHVEVFDNSERLLGTIDHVQALSATVDLAILPRLQGGIVALSLAPSAPRVGEQIIVIGSPEGLTNTVSDGIVSAFRTIEGRRLLQITAPISPGSSGGPVLNGRGEVVGVSVSMLREGQNLNFAVPVSDIMAVAESPVGRISFPMRGPFKPASSHAPIEGWGAGEKWIPAASSSGAEFAFDPSRITPIGERVYRIWTRTSFHTLQQKRDPWDTLLQQEDVDCLRPRQRVMIALKYLGHEKVGAFNTESLRDWFPVDLDSPFGRFRQAVCDYLDSHPPGRPQP